MNPSPSALPAILLAEDDPVSASFLAEAIRTLPAMVTTVTTIAEAEAACRQHRFDLLLIDAHLPDGRGETLLQALRQQGIHTPALAHTANADATVCDRLSAAGFLQVLSKPIPLAALHTALRQHLHDWPGASPAWDDATALLAVGGNPAHMHALRGLFLKELPLQQARIANCLQQGDTHGVMSELHKLTASCGFVGAGHVAQAVQALRAAPRDARAQQALDQAIKHTLEQPPPVQA